MLDIVLVEPEIPHNTGAIARTCAATGSRLHIVKPMGFTIDDRKLKRAGLDYWHLLDITYYENLADFFEKNAGGKFFYFSTKAEHIHSDVVYPDNAYIVFGKETKGLPEDFLRANIERCVRIPMPCRCSPTCNITVVYSSYSWPYCTRISIPGKVNRAVPG